MTLFIVKFDSWRYLREAKTYPLKTDPWDVPTPETLALASLLERLDPKRGDVLATRNSIDFLLLTFATRFQ